MDRIEQADFAYAVTTGRAEAAAIRLLTTCQDPDECDRIIAARDRVYATAYRKWREVVYP